MTNNYSKVKKVLWLILIANMSVALLKIVIGSLIRSAGMMADGIHSLSDGSSNVIGLIGIRFASRPVDKDHPYGHGKFENLAALFIAGTLFLLGGKIILTAINRFMNPVIPQVTVESLIILVTTLIINIFVCVFEYQKGKSLNSQILISDSIHTKTDIYISVGVLITLLGIKLGLPYIIDPIASLIVSLFILIAAIGIFRQTSDVLLDKAAVDTERLMKIALSFDHVKDIHNIRSRGSANNLHVDMHVMTDPDMSVEDSHNLIHNIENKIRNEINENAQVIIHIEPFRPTTNP